MRFGVRSVSMDDLARETAISKKTLYRCFRDKDDLVRQTLMNHLNTLHAQIDTVMESIEDPIEQIERIAGFVLEHARDVNPSLINDLRKYHPECFNLFSESRMKIFYAQVHRNIESGIAMGLYRANINSEILTRLYLNNVMSLIDPEVFPGKDTPFETRYRELIRYHLNGIVSEQGRQKIKDLSI
jgi:TetR/AcrR family transcriptional regulator, cholesterol catabolism regulator